MKNYQNVTDERSFVSVVTDVCLKVLMFLWMKRKVPL